ncbi:hypothetical protein PHLGIDRAFT_417590 [Phlebiopsis gigantea 11061_1 CR5-6]|uniref:WW domain-containing protein n=1 Tax=Phlebiopsis gigantea (strain 11061_1 CR5-6) TaxID=745531 RepID=A0A0C3PVG5_PHLG1|nr:hypothetical protein PHLGIDRAFT_417590 [Phlebiopsis gigantea 11061_1 CR5-6]
MEDDAEVLDWGNEDDEAQVAVAYQQVGQDDAEDAVSLGGDEDDEIYPYKTPHEDLSKAQQTLPRSSQTPQQGNHGKRDLQRENSDTSQKPLSQVTDSSQLQRSHSLTQMIHGLPAKPIGAPTSPLPVPATTSTLASTMAARERRSNGPSKNVSSSRDRGTGLPPDWEERLPRNGGSNPYFYNVKTHQSTWTRPHFADLGSPSPDKGRDYDAVHSIVDRSPRRSVADHIARPPLTEVRRRASPGGSLTFDERHYRPGASSAVNMPSDLVDKHAIQTASPRSLQRPLSPRGPDRRRESRPITPPPSRRPRSVERPGRTQRAPSPPLTDRLPPRRDAIGVRRSPIQDRAWDRTRVSSGHDGLRGQDFGVEPTAHRGRRPLDDALPERMRNNQEPHASRPRSPPSHLRDPSPQRRYVEHESVGRDSRQKGQYDRHTTPPPQRPRGNDSYPPTDIVPQRRTREYDLEYESDMKRRRMDEDPYKRRSSVERASYSPLLDRQALQAEAGKKRPPLPPQSEHFRGISRVPPGADVPMPQHPSHPLPMHADNYAGGRGDVQYSDGPLATRGHYTPRVREADTRYAPSRPRYEEVRTDDTMDVDYPSQKSRSESTRGELPPSRPRGNDRPALGLQMDTLPKGPRAMSRAHGSLSHTPPSPSPVLPSVPIRMPEPVSSNGRLSRVPPPHPRQDPIPQTRASGPPSGPRVHGDYPEIERRPSRFQDAPSSRDVLSMRSNRRGGDPVPSEPKASGTNNIAIAAKRLTPPAPPIPSPVVERVPAARHVPESPRAPPLVPYVPEADSTYSVRPVQARSRRESVSGHGNSAASLPSPHFNMPPPNALRAPAREEVPSSSAPRPERQVCPTYVDVRLPPEH